MAKLLVIAGREIDSEMRRELLEGSGQAIRVGSGSIEDVAGEKNDVRFEARGNAGDVAAESQAVHVAQMQIADHQGRAAPPGFRQVRQHDRNALDANPSGVQQAIETGHDGQRKKGFSD